MQDERPIPIPNDLTRPYWDAAARGLLMIQRCENCTRYIHPPRPLCPACGGSTLHFVEVSGRGRIETMTDVHRTFARGFESRLPYVLALVELNEQRGLRVLSNVVDSAPGSATIGTPVEVVFEQFGDFGLVPQFAVVDTDREPRRSA